MTHADRPKTPAAELKYREVARSMSGKRKGSILSFAALAVAQPQTAWVDRHRGSATFAR
jgi:hypothetical protein